MNKLKTNKRKRIMILLVILFLIFAGLQFFGPKIINPPVTGDLKVPHEVQTILKTSCYDCHSNQTNLSWYDKIAPVSWLVAQHIKDGRSGLNFSNWDALSPADQKAKLWESINQISLGAMPLSSYTLAHPQAKLSQKDIKVLKDYIWSLRINNVIQDTAKIKALNKQSAAVIKSENKTKLPMTVNGIEYIADYKNWAVVSTTQRLDNGTMRIIYGNSVAVKAIKEKKIDSWPDGTILAKAAYDEIEDSDGNISQGAFKQVEFMIKDHDKYKKTYGWGFARFKTPELLPYGKNADFVIDCMNCHQPMKNNDYVFTLPIRQ
ncbi:heme-binding domain-containing protein [Flavobacterium sp. ANB]|uniref:heme-binding domain-containing protein n=1 Tax=unclassified Flavobacterium TaxID=196869 RepID=UPI0012B96BC0|nr:MULTISPECIES: heme-binding domain-containing protein [unclassified Flavobacterium]MBF4515757.1 heme-binding domain-containing protein [Flavobacterium sp. ANB]MTD68760.1 cytochrome P460 [Flavobacterium sp. LC2016-13]